MTIDLEIIREILVRLEGSNTKVNMNDFEGIEGQSVAYNMRLLHDAQCIEAEILDSSRGDRIIRNAIARRLTLKGHRLLDALRNETVRNKIKEKLQSNARDMTIDMVIELGKRFLKSMI